MIRFNRYYIMQQTSVSEVEAGSLLMKFKLNLLRRLIVVLYYALRSVEIISFYAMHATAGFDCYIRVSNNMILLLSIMFIILHGYLLIFNGMQYKFSV